MNQSWIAGERPLGATAQAQLAAEVPEVTLDDALVLLKRLKRDLMHARRFQPDVLHTYRRACTSAESDIEEFLSIAKAAGALSPNHRNT
jgi:hypothetical protein